MSVQEYMALAVQERRKRSIGSGLLNDSQFTAAEKVATQLPFLRVDRAFFKVVGEKFITPGSLVQFVIKARIIPPGATNVPELTEKDLADIDPKEGDLDALHGRKKGVEAEEAKKAEIAGQPPLAHAPYLARDHSPRWHIFLGDNRQGKIVVPPFTFTKFDKPLFDESGNPTYNVQTLKMQFGAPPQAGQYRFTMFMVCDSYVGMDTKMDVTLSVDEATKAAEIEEEEEISEPEEGKISPRPNYSFPRTHSRAKTAILTFIRRFSSRPDERAQGRRDQEAQARRCRRRLGRERDGRGRDGHERNGHGDGHGRGVDVFSSFNFSPPRLVLA